MIKAPDILSPLDFFGIEGELILIEFDEEVQLESCFCDVIAFTPQPVDIRNVKCAAIQCDNIARAVRMIKGVNQKVDFLIHRIDLFNLDLTKRSRGNLIKGHVSMLGPKILRGRNVFFTSCKEEYMLREVCDRFIDVKEHSE